MAIKKGIAENYLQVVENASPVIVLVQSSTDAHLGQCAGPADRLTYQKQILTKAAIDSVYLRPGCIYNNLYAHKKLSEQTEIFRAHIGGTEKLVLAEQQDIQNRPQRGCSVRKRKADSVLWYIASDEASTEIIEAAQSKAG